MKNKKHNFIFRNSLVIVFLLLALISISGQFYNGWKEHNDFLAENGKQAIDATAYIRTGHFIQATFENWESEFLQMFLLVVLTIFLRQQGSSESKSCDEPVIDPAELKVKPDSPWPVKKGGIWLSVYKNSLSIVLFMLFAVSFVFHYYGSWKDYNEAQQLQHLPLVNIISFAGSAKFWFESFQNWQSEFLSVFAIIFLSIYLRQIGSSQSKPVNAAHSETGSE